MILKACKIISLVNPMHPQNNTLQPLWMIALCKANSAKRCGAKTRSTHRCKAPAMKNGRCRMHGGKSPGAPCGVKHGRYKNGLHTKEIKQVYAHIRTLMKNSQDIIITSVDMCM